MNQETFVGGSSLLIVLAILLMALWGVGICSRYRKAGLWYRTCKDCGTVRETTEPKRRKVAKELP